MNEFYKQIITNGDSSIITFTDVSFLSSKVQSVLPTTDGIHLDQNGEYVVIGDIHGNINALVSIISHFGLPGSETSVSHDRRVRKYVCLGDYIDRGDN